MSLTIWPRNDGTTSPLVSTGGAGLGELTGDTADFHDRQTAVREYDRHLKDHAELVAYRVGRTVKRFGAVTRLEQERFTSSDTGQLIGEVPSLAGEHEGRHLTEQFERLIELPASGRVGWCLMGRLATCWVSR